MTVFPKSAQAISQYLPHSEQMCLLHEVISIDENNILCRAISHLDINNPLRVENELSAICAVEYAAQAVALHLALKASALDTVPASGFLAAVQDCVLHLQCFDTLTAPLDIACQHLFSDEKTGSFYEFTLSSASMLLVTGQLLVMYGR